MPSGLLRFPKGRAFWLTARYWFFNHLQQDKAKGTTLHQTPNTKH
jgi:hypothetical protein